MNLQYLHVNRLVIDYHDRGARHQTPLMIVHSVCGIVVRVAHTETLCTDDALLARRLIRRHTFGLTGFIESLFIVFTKSA